MNEKLDYETDKANGVIVGPNELTVEQSVRLEMIKLLLPQNPNAPLTVLLKMANLYTDFILRGGIPE